MKLAYVILHYLAVKDTIECVTSIIENIDITENQLEIIVVDNGSPCEQYSELEKLLNKYSGIHLLRSDDNLGFARGNNIGFNYAKHKLKADFIILLNNDTVIKQKDFSDVIVRKYREYNYSVLGPDIITADGFHQNPGSKQEWTVKELNFFILKKRIRLVLSYCHLDGLADKFKKHDKEIYRPNAIEGDVKNTILHGACLIFSPQYIERFDGLNDQTFLYMEEDVLKLYSDFYGFLMLYSSDLSVFHKEDVATNLIRSTNEERVRLKSRRLIDSAKVYKSLKQKMRIKKKVFNVIEKIADKSKNEGGYSIDLDIPVSYLMSYLMR